MTHVTCRLTAKNRDQLRNTTLGNRVWASFTFRTCIKVYLHMLFCSLAVLDPRAGHTMDVLFPVISILCHCNWLFHGQSCPRLEVVHPGCAWPSSPACTWHHLFFQATPLFPHGVTVWLQYASFLALTVSNSSLLTPALLWTHSIYQSTNQLCFRQISNKTAVKELNTATLSDWASRQKFCTNRHPENRLIQ